MAKSSNEAQILLKNAKSVHAIGPRPSGKFRKVSLFLVTGLVMHYAYQNVDFDKINQNNNYQVQQSKEKFDNRTISKGDDIVKKINFTSNQIELPFEIEDNDDHYSLVQKLYNNDLKFEAATLQVEGLETSPYYIEGNDDEPTIGVGYNIKQSIKATSKEDVIRELSSAGIDNKNISYLLSKDRKISSKAKITNEQAIKLLKVSSYRFDASTSSAIGLDVWNKLPDHRKIALKMLDYHANIRTYPNLIAKVRQGDTNGALKNMNSYISIGGRGHRLNDNMAVAQGIFYSQSLAHEAIMNPEKIKRDFRQNNLSWQKRLNTNIDNKAKDNSNKDKELYDNSQVNEIPSNARKENVVDTLNNHNPSVDIMEDTIIGVDDKSDMFAQARRRVLEERMQEGYSIGEEDLNLSQINQDLHQSVINNTKNNFNNLKSRQDTYTNTNKSNTPRR